jgi:hypothetical protein
MSKFVQLEQVRPNGKTYTLIVNLDAVIAAEVEMKRVTLRPDLSYNLTDRGWNVLMEHIPPKEKVYHEAFKPGVEFRPTK